MEDKKAPHPMAVSAVELNGVMTEGIKAVVRGMATVDNKAAEHVAFEYGLIVAGMKIQAALIAGELGES